MDEKCKFLSLLASYLTFKNIFTWQPKFSNNPTSLAFIISPISLRASCRLHDVSSQSKFYGCFTIYEQPFFLKSSLCKKYLKVYQIIFLFFYLYFAHRIQQTILKLKKILFNICFLSIKTQIKSCWIQWAKYKFD